MLIFSEFKGRRERQLVRMRDNPLFPAARRKVTPQGLLEAQRLDHEELVEFIPGFRTLLHRAATLRPNEDSAVILEIKEQLDKAYETAAGLADDQSETLEAIRRLTVLIMQAVRRGAEGDPLALDELDQEDQARAAHYELLRHPLLADLLYPDSPVTPDDLVPTLLSSAEEELAAVLTLFEAEQIGDMVQQGEALLAATPDAPPGATDRLGQMRRALDA